MFGRGFISGSAFASIFFLTGLFLFFIFTWIKRRLVTEREMILGIFSVEVCVVLLEYPNTSGINPVRCIYNALEL